MSPLTKRRLFLIAGLSLIFFGVCANEWILAVLFSSDGDISPARVVKIRLLNVLAIGLGILVIVSRRLLAKDRPVLSLMRNYPRIAALTLGCVLVVVVIAAAEVVFFFIRWATEPNLTRTIRVTTLQGDPVSDWFTLPDERLGYKATPERRCRFRLEADGEEIYDVVYETDPFGRRSTMVPDGAARTKFILCFGGSFTFGEGVEAGETLPSCLTALSDHHLAYNYGFRGYGPQQMLNQLRHGDLRRQVQEDSGVCIYTAIDGHIARAIGTMRICDENRRHFSRFVLDKQGQLVLKGTFADSRPWRQLLFDVLCHSQTLKYLKADLPPYILESHLEVMAAIIKESQEEFARQFDSDRFYVVIYPGAARLPRLIPHLGRQEVEYLDCSKLFDPTDPSYHLKFDGHPTPQAYQRLAAKIVTHLEVKNP